MPNQNRISAFIDSTTMYRAGYVLKANRLEYKALLVWLKETYKDDFLRAYVYMSTQSDGRLDGMVRFLSRSGFTVKTQVYDERWATHMHVYLAMDVVTQVERLKTVVLVVRDPTFLPLVAWLKERGVTVSLLSLPQIADPILIDMVDQFYSLDKVPGIIDPSQEELNGQKDDR